ncbi:MAG: metal ABC transporter ATP-binding protein [Meiothermus sp.]|uniref:metal ABC transporter ATP-binding protein n=1 Tax=Meiothermus sp. TaxID=1955249 RepID=UPI002600DA10|nr:metal ABC transporter ATP-binding protein [Meiothermus sp.]MCS7068357.1 metal ABC transporter ATP-binding protein [Meiothermus sp.]MCX7600746.1 metal ABC transporter ATP-binding protein [Meiothermus sp.]MDW8426032.1 metal ABC transporter ATP-binding protein [Meiothermus sp.]
MTAHSTTDAQPPLSVRDLTVVYHEKPVLWDIDWEVPAGRLCAIVGPNGAGKSTLLKAVLGLLPRASGQVWFFGKTLAQARARIAYVPQRGTVDWDFPTSVLDVVMMGLYGRLGWFKRPGAPEREAALRCLEQVSMQALAHRQIAQLSGGQQQRVFLARALAQNADLYFMDEPFAGVDAVTEEAILRVLHQLKQQGKTVVVVHHDLETVRAYFDHLTLLNVQVIASGPMEATFTPENLKRTYGERMTGASLPMAPSG